MLDRNKRIKPRPERFQAARDKFDILVTCEERVYDQVIEGTCQLLSCDVIHTLLETRCSIFSCYNLNGK